MAAGQKWTREETLCALALYFLLPSGQHDKSNPDIVALAEALGRTPSSVVLKLANIKAHDPMRKGVGMTHGSKLDALVWEEFAQRGDGLTGEAMELLVDRTEPVVAPKVTIDYVARDLPVGRDRPVVATARANQRYFRNALLDNYEHRCCVSGIGVEKLLVASHIKPWSASDPATERLSPENGLLLDALHDRAFDQGLMTIDFDLRVVISRKVPRDAPCTDLLWRYDGRRIDVPGRFRPRREFIEYHNDVVFQG